MSDIELIACCESFGIGVELVQSIYKGWTFKLPDTVAGFGLHGQYKILEEMAIPFDENNKVALIDKLKSYFEKKLKNTRAGKVKEYIRRKSFSCPEILHRIL